MHESINQARESARKRLAQLSNEYLKNGGTITKLPYAPDKNKLHKSCYPYRLKNLSAYSTIKQPTY